MIIDFNLLLEESTRNKEILLAELPPDYQWPERLDVPTGSPEAITEELFGLLRKLYLGEYTPLVYTKRVGRYLRKLAARIQKEKRYGNLVSAFSAFEKRVRDFPSEVCLSLVDDFAIVYLRLIRRSEILAGVRGGVYWKRLQIPSGASPLELISIAYQMMPFLHIIGHGELELVPVKFLSVIDYPRVVVPTPRNSVVDLLTEAYYNQRYTVPSTGVVVRFRNAGDLESMIIKQVGSSLLAKVTTPYGDTLAHLSLDLACGYSFETILDFEERIPHWMAVVYRDLVTAETLEVVPKRAPLTGERKRRAKLHQPSLRFLPRVRREGRQRGVREIRGLYRGPRRPPKLHPIVGHPRKVRMTEKHYRALLKWQKKTGLRVPWHVVLEDPSWDDRNVPSLERIQASGNTFVRPHFSPVSDEVVAKMPTFIKQALQEEIVRRASGM